MSQPKIISLSGWAQNPNSLEPLLLNLPLNYKIINFDYSQFSTLENCFNEIKNISTKPNSDILVGWSLGGQIATRLVANRILNPKLLILIAPPFQFVKSKQIAAAMPKNTFEAFKENFIKNSAQTLEKFSLLMMLNNATRAKELAKNLYVDEKNYKNLVFWLEELGNFSCFDLNFDNFPRTVIFHGDSDLVVHHLQSEVFASKIINSRLETLKNCGHCPHISNQSQLEKIINEEINLIK